jgi:hypothetical protein
MATLMLLLHIAPLLSTSFSLMFSWDQDFFLTLFLHPTISPQSDAILLGYFTPFFDQGGFIILGLYAIAVLTAGATLVFETTASGGSAVLRWYWAG